MTEKNILRSGGYFFVCGRGARKARPFLFSAVAAGEKREGRKHLYVILKNKYN